MSQQNIQKQCIKIRDIRELIVKSKDVFIRPPGRRVYFEGKIDDIPENLLDLEIAEIIGAAFYDTERYSVKRYSGMIGFLVLPTLELDKLSDSVEEGNKLENKEDESINFI